MDTPSSNNINNQNFSPLLGNSLVPVNTNNQPQNIQWKTNESLSDLFQMNAKNPLLFIGLGIFLLLFSVFAITVGFKLGGDNLVTNFPKADTYCNYCESDQNPTSCKRLCSVIYSVKDVECPANLFTKITIKRGDESVVACQVDNSPSCVKPSDCNNWFTTFSLNGYSAACYDAYGLGEGKCMIEPFVSSKKSKYASGKITYESCECTLSASELLDVNGACRLNENKAKEVTFVCKSCNNSAKYVCPAE